MSISIYLKDFWALPCLIGIEKDEFYGYLEQYKYEFGVKSESEKASILVSVEQLKESLSIIEIDDLYSYIQTSYADERNHHRLDFAALDIVEEKLGIYHHK